MDMEVDDEGSPIGGIIFPKSPTKRITPAVPTPDWNHQPKNKPVNIENVLEYSQDKQMEISSSEKTHIENNHNETPGSSSDETRNRKKLILNLDSINKSHSTSNVPTTPSMAVPTTPRPHVPSTPTSRVIGDVALTPTNSAYTPSHLQNPQMSLTAVTPMASGPNQAKNSIKIQNCVSTVSLGCDLKLLDVYCRTRFSEYNPSRFHGVIMKILEPRATALIFRSGKIVCTGTRTEHDAYMATRKFARIIQKLGYPAKFVDFKIQNFIATADLRFPVRLEALQQAHGQFTSYEPELFPGLVYRMVRPRVVLLIFVNGKIVFTGGKTRNEISESLDIIYPILRSYRKN